MHHLRRACCYLGLVLLTGAAAAAEGDLAARVVVVANSSVPESVALAHYYCEKRAIPGENIIGLPLSTEETYNWPQFITTLYEPLRAELIKRGWVESIDTALKDALGRKKYPVSGHRIAYLVLCRGVPLRVGPDWELAKTVPPPLVDRNEFRTIQASIEGELSLLIRNDHRINGWIPNPLFGKQRPTMFDQAAVVKVARLDGPSYESARALVDGALAAERDGLVGRAYVDFGGGPYGQGEQWFREVAKLLETAPLDLVVDSAPPLLATTSRFDAPVLYFGWHSPNVNGPFLQPGFRFPPGAIALHLHSFSAVTLNTDSGGWTGPFVARGVTATFGNVFEPYLDLTHRPDMLLMALLRGDTLGDAAYFALPAVSWHPTLVGDPLYRPFKRRFSEVWGAREKASDALYPYIVLADVRRMEREGQGDQALALCRETLASRPSLPVALRLARLLLERGKSREVAPSLDKVAALRPWTAVDAPLLMEAAELLDQAKQREESLRWYRRILEIATLHPEQKQLALERGLRAAEAAKDEALTERWAAELAALKGR